MNTRREISWLRREFEKEPLGLKRAKVTNTGIGYNVEGITKMRNGIWIPRNIRDDFRVYSVSPGFIAGEFCINLERIKNEKDNGSKR